MPRSSEHRRLTEFLTTDSSVGSPFASEESSPNRRAGFHARARNLAVILTIFAILGAACSGSTVSDSSLAEDLDPSSEAEGQVSERDTDGVSNGSSSSSAESANNDTANNDTANNDSANNDTANNDSAGRDSSDGDSADGDSTNSELVEDGSGFAEGSCGTLLAGSATITVLSGSNTYDVQILVPSAAASGEALPLVMNWHGLGSNGIEQIALTDFESVAEREGFIVVHPTGLAIPGTSTSSWELDGTSVPGRDDLAFANDLIDSMIENYCVDATRVYSTGMSNGGFFTSRLVCELSDRLAAASSIAGLSHFEECDPERPVPFLGFHGTEDDVVPFNGGKSSLAGGDLEIDASFFEQKMPGEFAEFAQGAGCSLETVVIVISEEVNRYDYKGCEAGTPMSFYEVIGGGHTWPGSALGIFLTEVLGKTTMDVSATELSWAFFQQHRTISE